MRISILQTSGCQWKVQSMLINDPVISRLLSTTITVRILSDGWSYYLKIKINLNMKHDQPVMDVIPCSFQSGFRRLPTRGLWMTNPCQNSKYPLTHFYIRFLLEVNLPKVKRTYNIYRMFQDSVYINCLQYLLHSDNILNVSRFAYFAFFVNTYCTIIARFLMTLSSLQY